MESYIQTFCEYRKEKKQVSENTILAYRSDLQRMVNYLRGNGIVSPEQVTETQLNSFILSAEREGLKASSLVRLISSIHGFFDYLTKKGIIKEDPSERIKAPKAEQAKQEIVSVEELETLLTAPDTDTPKGLRDRAMLELLYATGIHLNSLLSLTLSQVHLRYKVLTVSVGEQNRVLPLGKPACDALEVYLEHGREAFKKEKSDPELLFYNKAGEQMTRQGFFKRITEYTKKTGLPNITPRILRNSMINHLMSNGASYAGVHQLLGTKRLSAALNYERQTQTIPDMYKKAHPRA